MDFSALEEFDDEYFEGLQRQIEESRDRVAEVTRSLSEQRHIAHSEDGAIEATVDGNGKLMDLYIARGELSRTQPSKLGAKVVATIVAAKSEAARKSREVLQDSLPQLSSDWSV